MLFAALMNPAAAVRRMLTGAQSHLVSWVCCVRQGHVAGPAAQLFNGFRAVRNTTVLSCTSLLK